MRHTQRGVRVAQLAAQDKRGRRKGTNPGPGRIWRHATTMVQSTIFVHGGYRLWHGFDKKHHRQNRFNDSEAEFEAGATSTICGRGTSTRPTRMVWRTRGTIFVAVLLCGKSTRSCAQTTSRRGTSTPLAGASCGLIKWSQRFEELCVTTWPKTRAGHKMVYHEGYLYIFGGYRARCRIPQR